MKEPLVTIIAISYNHALYLEECINSILAQTYPNIQLIVADDCSKDNSRSVIQALSEQHGFLFLPNENNIGLNNTILNAMEHANGAYISIIAADDFMDTEKTHAEVTYLLSTGKDGVYANGTSVNENMRAAIQLNPVFAKNDREAILDYIYQYDWGAPLLQSGLFAMDLFRELLPLRKEYKSDDWAFLIRSFEKYDVGYIDRPLFFYRLHGDNTHKKYWLTYPMRIDIVSRLVPDTYRMKAMSNIMLSQGQYLLADKKFFQGLRMFFASVSLHMTGKKSWLILKVTGVFFRDKFLKK